ncbi:MAG: hypothetical protein PHY93_06885 [Bacteriovorax sp.]|nr:hypothetical protein [Bacteriovorax sp.]
MKKISILHLGLALTGLLFHNLSFATLSLNAPKELKYFIENDFDSIHMQALKTHAVPVKILLPSLILEGRSKGWIAEDSFDYKEVFKRSGLTYPQNIIFNAKSYSWKSELLPLGLVQKEMGFGIKANVKIANLSCVACHSGSQYDQNGKKTNNQIIGAPSDTFNPEMYVTTLYEGMKKVNQNWARATAIMNQLFPDTNLKEKLLYKTIIRLQVRSYMKAHASIDRATPFLNGGPGLTNGVASLKNVLGLDVFEGSASGFTSIPSIGDRGFRSSLLYDGVYSIAHKDSQREVQTVTNQSIDDISTVVALFTVPTMGQTTARAYKNISTVKEIVGPILKIYKTPDFPGTIIKERAERGFAIYNSSCLQCHGEYKWDGGKKSQLISFPNKLVPQNEMNSDANRWLAVTLSLSKNLENSVWNDTLQVNHNKGYIAPLLEGLWATAPYMHNGSVPTLWQFMRPDMRPAKFVVGNQNLEMNKVGIAALASFGSEIYDTSLAGRNNHGHEKEFEELSDADKDDLLEYLKTL